MSLKELDRLQIIRDSVSRQITQEQAADRIGIYIRQVKRLVQRYRVEGPQVLVSRRRDNVPTMLLLRIFVLSSSHLSEINIRISDPLLPVRSYVRSMG